MTTRAKCQCKDSCPFPADEGQPYKLAHDPRPERAVERAALMSKIGSKGRGVVTARRAAADAARSDRASRSTVRNVEGQLDVIDLGLHNLLRSRLDAGKVANGIATLVKVAREVLASVELTENRQLRELILEKHPELKKHLKVVP